jgi:uncharacterized membrane protein YsdA (DUF1294 family)
LSVRQFTLILQLPKKDALKAEATINRFFVLLFLSLKKVKKRDLKGTREIQNFNSACVVTLKRENLSHLFYTSSMNSIILIFIGINILTFTIFGFDKLCAIKNKRRISEKNLHTVSLFGGFIGALFAMILFRHKIKKPKFILIQVFIYCIWIVLYFQKSLLIFS